MDYLSWETLATIAGSTAAVVGLTQGVKLFVPSNKIHPKWIALFFAAVIQISLYFIQGDLTWQNAVLAFFNTFIVVLAAYKSFEIGRETANKVLKKDEGNNNES